MKKFKKIYVEITNSCNLRCSFCPTTSRKTKFMSTLEFNQILQDISKHTKFIYLHVKGEPLFHPDIDKFLNLCDQYNLKVCLTTNGTLLKNHKDTLINSKSLHKLQISLHSFEANDLKISVDEYLSSIIDIIKSASFITVLRLWNNGGMDDMNNKIISLIKQNLNHEFNVSLENHTKIIDNCYLEFGDTFKWPKLNDPIIQENGFCYALRNQVAILACGTVVPCCLDNNGDIPLGNIFVNSLHDIISNDISKSLFNGFSERKLNNNLCKTCGFITRFSN